eukprot:Hpha_TRINITY_DN15317_c0_g4::TRINITY_DN15317_c0_g4_i1::g.89490::m.89490
MALDDPPVNEPLRGWAALAKPVPDRLIPGRRASREGRVMAFDSGINASAAARISLPMSIGPVSTADLGEHSAPQTPRTAVIPALPSSRDLPSARESVRDVLPSARESVVAFADIMTPGRMLPAGPTASPTPRQHPGLSRASSRGDIAASVRSGYEPSPPRSWRGSQATASPPPAGGTTTDVLSAYGWSSLVQEPAAVRATVASATPRIHGASSGPQLYTLERARAADSLGINVDDDGLEIVKVEYGLPAHLAGVPVGGRLLEVNGVSVESVAEMRQAVRRGGRRVQMLIGGQHLSRQAAAAQGLVPRSVSTNIQGALTKENSSCDSSVAASPHSASPTASNFTPTDNVAATKPSFFRRLSSSHYGGKDPWDLLPDLCVEVPEGAESRYNESKYRCGIQCIELPERGQAPAVVGVHFVAEGDGLGDLQAPDGSRLALNGSPLDIFSLDTDINQPRTMISGRIYFSLPIAAQIGDQFSFTYGSATYSTAHARVIRYEPVPKEMTLTAQRRPGERLGIDFYDDNLEVMRVAEGSPAALAGVTPGMKIRRVSGRGVRTVMHVKEQMDAHTGGDLVIFVDSWVRRPPPPLWVVPLRPMRFYTPPPSGSGLQQVSQSRHHSTPLTSFNSSGPASPAPTASPAASPGSRHASARVSGGEQRLRNENERLRMALTTTTVAREGDRESGRQAREEVHRLKDQLAVAQTKIRSDEHTLSRLASGCHDRAQVAAKLRHENTARECELTRALKERDEQIRQMSEAMEVLLDRIGGLPGTGDVRMRVMSKENKVVEEEEPEVADDAPLVSTSQSGCAVPRWLHLTVTILLAASTSALAALLIMQS